MDTVWLAVNGTLMRGLALEGNLRAVGAAFVREDETEKAYRLYSIRDEHPAMVRVAADDPAAVSVAVEVWAVPKAGLAEVLLREPAGLSVGKVKLQSGKTVLGVIAEPLLTAGAKEISAYGGWRAYIEAGRRE